MTIKQILNTATETLKNNKIDNPIMHARLLLEFVLKKDKTYIIVNDEKEIDENTKNKYLDVINRLSLGEPLQYITNHQEFMKLDFYVDENVLIPRADTEVLVEEALNIINRSDNNLKILDMCTGSGAIAITIASYTEKTKVYAADFSQNALEVAKKNAVLNNVENKCDFIHSDMFKNINEKFDIIISNPPYIKRKIIKSLDLNVQKEPIMALDGGEDGLDFYKILAENSYEFLKEKGILMLEIGYDQKQEVMNLLEKTRKYDEIHLKKDLAQNDRVIIATKR